MASCLFINTTEKQSIFNTTEKQSIILVVIIDYPLAGQPVNQSDSQAVNRSVGLSVSRSVSCSANRQIPISQLVYWLVVGRLVSQSVGRQSVGRSASLLVSQSISQSPRQSVMRLVIHSAVVYANQLKLDMYRNM